VKARELIRIHEKLTDLQFALAIKEMSEHEKDLLVVCKGCGASEGEECKNLGKKKIVHFGRRLHRLIKGIR
jgi:hypothetical protein